MRYVCFLRALPFVLLLKWLPHPFLRPFLVPPPIKTYNKRTTQPGSVVAGVVDTVPQAIAFLGVSGAYFFDGWNGLGLPGAP